MQWAERFDEHGCLLPDKWHFGIIHELGHSYMLQHASLFRQNCMPPSFT